MSSSDEAQRLRDIIQNSDNAMDYVGTRNHAAFAADQKTIDAVERCIERIAEAMIKIGVNRMAEIAPDIPLPGVRQLGNIMRHEYDVVDTRLVFAMVVDRMPKLRAACAAVLEGVSVGTRNPRCKSACASTAISSIISVGDGPGWQTRINAALGKVAGI